MSASRRHPGIPEARCGDCGARLYATVNGVEQCLNCPRLRSMGVEPR